MSPAPGQARQRSAGLYITVILAVLVVVADQLSKAWVLNHLGPGGDRSVVNIIPGVLRLFYVENSGAAFGMFRGGGSILTIVAVIVVLILAIAFRQLIGRNLLLSIALGLQFGGAVGNIVDRFRHGFVVDFINVPHFWTFNLADSAITVGVIILAVFLVFYESDAYRVEQARLSSGEDSGSDPGAGAEAPRLSETPVLDGSTKSPNDG